MSTKKDNLDQRIASIIRAERELRGWSLTDMAERSGVSRAMIHKIERGISSPTAVLLGKLSGAFNLSMSKLIARAELPDGQLLRHKDQPVWVDPSSGYIRRHVSPRSDLPLDLVHIELPPGTEIPMPASVYSFLQQLIWVLSGSLTFIEGETRHEMEKGDCLELGAPVDCVFKNESSQPCIYLVTVLTPIQINRKSQEI